MTWKTDAETMFKASVPARQISRELNVPRRTVRDFIGKLKRVEQAQEQHQSSKVLFVDVESSPAIAYIWKRWKENIPLDRIIEEGYLLSFSAKWLGSSTIIFEHISEECNDKQLCEKLHMLFSKADVVVAHNGINFDFPLIRTRMLKHGMKPYSKNKEVDTLQIAKKMFRFPSNSLDGIAAYLGLQRKYKHSGFELWKRCMALDAEAFVEMQEYNDTDIEVLEQVYLALRAWDKTKPNLAVISGSKEMACVCCGSKSLDKLEKLAHTNISSFTQYQCRECGSFMRDRVNIRSKDEMKQTLVN